MCLLVLLFLPRHLLAIDGDDQPPGWVGFCSGPVWPLSTSKTKCLQSKKHYLKILQTFQDPSSYWWTEHSMLLTATSLLISIWPIQTACISFHVGIRGTQSLRTTAPSPEVPFGASSCWEKDTTTPQALPCQSPSLFSFRSTLATVSQWADFARGLHLFIVIFHLNNFLMFYVARMPLPFKEGSMQ